MKVRVLASTKVGHIMSKEEAFDFSGKSAGICYMPDDLDTLFSEQPEKTQRRANGTLNSGHFSVFGHPHYNLAFEEIPKILAMVLNNEKLYNTSEKSARYTKMQPSPEEKELYEKWIEIYKEEILKMYPNFDDKRALKLAQENARYLISVFTPATVMEYTVDFEQLNFILYWMEEYINNEPDYIRTDAYKPGKENVFVTSLKNTFRDTLDKLSEFRVKELNTELKGRKLSLFADRKRKEEFGENYCTTYLASFAQLAQAQRHRTLSYEISLLEHPEYYVPSIILGTDLEEEWLEDISSLGHNFPQGMFVEVNERGTIENFVLKCQERLCGYAQLEIQEQTLATLDNYLWAVKDDKALHDYLLPYSKGARCTFPSWKCNSPCIFGGKYAMKRRI